jgi:hypothetical protein
MQDAESSRKRYERLLGELEGTRFQAEVSARLQSLIIDFQRIPEKPRGDGGLDGLSHGQSRGYCCYGPQYDPAKMKKQGLKESIVRKFRSDLLKLFELKNSRGSFSDLKSLELNTIMAPGNKLTNIFLIVNWFESHRIIGPLNECFKQCKSNSRLRYVDSAATLTVWGPADLAAQGAIDEHTLFRTENPVLLSKLQEASAAVLSPDLQVEFDEKFGYLAQRRPKKRETISTLAEGYRAAWAASITLDNELAETSVTLHEALEIARETAAQSARLLSLQNHDPYQLIGLVKDKVGELLGETFGQRLGSLTDKVADGVVAGLIGECPLDWRDDNA